GQATDNITPQNQIVYATQLDNNAYSAYAPWTTTSSTVTYNNLSGGAHVFRVKAKDLSGNESVPTAPTSLRNFTYTPPDTTPPTVTFGAASGNTNPAENGSVSTLPVTYTWSGSDNVTPP